jgi:hypothetical protein
MWPPWSSRCIILEIVNRVTYHDECITSRTLLTSDVDCLLLAETETKKLFCGRRRFDIDKSRDILIELKFC